MTNSASTHVGFVPEPHAGRGTIGILWQCLATIFLCVYTCLHLNIPPQPLSSSRAMLRYFWWIIIGLMAPEIMCIKAFEELACARTLSKHLEAHDLGHISTKQAHFLLWGGLRVQHDGKLLKCQTVGEWIIANDFADKDSCDFVKLLLQRVPTDAVIDDRSKADALTKVLACSQAFWVAIQVIARLQQHLDISLLEVVTVAYITMALLAYMAWFAKPYSLKVSEHIYLDGFESVKDQIRGKSYEDNWFGFDFAFNDIDRSPNSRKGVVEINAWIFALAVAFPAIHVAAWNYSFPTTPEKWLWRVSAVVLGVSAAIVPAYSACGLEEVFGESKAKLFLILLFGTYALVRTFLWVETFICFRSAPQGIYEAVNWAQYIGHIGS